VQAKVINKAKQEKVAAELAQLMPSIHNKSFIMLTNEGSEVQNTKVPQALLVDIFDDSPSESTISSPQHTPTLPHSTVSSQPALDTMWDPFSDISFPSSENSSPSLSQHGSPAVQRPPALPPKPASNNSSGPATPFDDWFNTPAQPPQPTTTAPALPPKPTPVQTNNPFTLERLEAEGTLIINMQLCNFLKQKQ
jgi:hypothetical protein